MSLNVAAVLWLLLWYGGAAKGTDWWRRQQVSELCRSGVINTNALHAQFPPGPASSSEAELAWSLSSPTSYFMWFILPAAVILILNTLVIEIFFTRK